MWIIDRLKAWLTREPELAVSSKWISDHASRSAKACEPDEWRWDWDAWTSTPRSER